MSPWDLETTCTQREKKTTQKLTKCQALSVGGAYMQSASSVLFSTTANICLWRGLRKSVRCSLTIIQALFHHFFLLFSYLYSTAVPLLFTQISIFFTWMHCSSPSMQPSYMSLMPYYIKETLLLYLLCKFTSVFRSFDWKSNYFICGHFRDSDPLRNELVPVISVSVQV